MKTIPRIIILSGLFPSGKTTLARLITQNGKIGIDFDLDCTGKSQSVTPFGVSEQLAAGRIVVICCSNCGHGTKWLERAQITNPTLIFTLNPIREN